MKYRVFTVTLIFALSAASSALAQKTPSRTQADIETMVDVLLNGIEYVPTKKDWDRIGPRAANVLRTVAADTRVLATKRGRAISALVFFSNAKTHAFLMQMLQDTKAPGLLRGKSARVLALSQQDAALPTLQPLLGHANKRFSEAVIKAVGLIRTPAARAALSKRLSKETRAYLKTVLKRAIQRIDKGQRR